MRDDDDRRLRFDPSRFLRNGAGGHGGLLGLGYHAHGDDWAELALPYSKDQIGESDTGVIASRRRSCR